MEIGLRMPPCEPIPQLAEFAANVEEAGFDGLYVPDSQTLWRDAYLTLYAAATRTKQLALGTAVSNVVTRHPTVIASLARSVDEIAPRRFFLGLGVGHSSIEQIGERPSRSAELTDKVAEIRRLVRGEDVNYGCGQARVRAPRPYNLPIHIAATGPRNLQMAGAIGDGIILLSGVSEPRLKSSLELIHHGAEQAERNPDELDITVSAHALVTERPERDARQLKPVLATMAQRGGQRGLEARGIHVKIPQHVPEVKPDLVHAEDWDLAVDVCSRWISDSDALTFAREFCLFGTPRDIAEQIQKVSALGVTKI